MRFSRLCGSYHEFLDRVLLLMRTPLNQEFLLLKIESTFDDSHRGMAVTGDHKYVLFIVVKPHHYPLHDLPPGISHGWHEVCHEWIMRYSYFRCTWVLFPLLVFSFLYIVLNYLLNDVRVILTMLYILFVLISVYILHIIWWSCAIVTRVVQELPTLT